MSTDRALCVSNMLVTYVLVTYVGNMCYGWMGSTSFDYIVVSRQGRWSCFLALALLLSAGLRRYCFGCLGLFASRVTYL
jgi:hypothetical protein